MALVKCPEYGTQVFDQANACSSCGHPVTSEAPVDADVRTCPRCAETVKAAAKVCLHCGHDFFRTERCVCGPALLSLLIPGLGQVVKGEFVPGHLLTCGRGALVCVSGLGHEHCLGGVSLFEDWQVGDL